jgi:hypothetical protein
MQKHKILTSFWFIFGLLILLLNDFVLKDVYGNWFTGKLSDFSGLFVFLTFWSTLLPKHRRIIFWLTGTLFIIWKSHYSQSFIDLWNSTGILNIHRTVDYSDLIALTILPIAYLYNSSDKQFIHLRVRPIYPIVFSAFAFAATSNYTKVEIESEYYFPYPKDTLTSKLHQLDSLNNGQGLTFSMNRLDTVTLSLPSTFCHNKFDAKIAVKQVYKNTSSLTLISVNHHCPKNKKDKIELKKEFQKKVVEKLKKGL